MELKDRVVLVTGSSKGIGRECAVLLSKLGTKVVITYLSDKKGGEETLKECNKYSDCLLLKLDVKSDASISKGVKEIIKRYGKIDLLINNAGILYDKDFSDQSMREIEEQINVNLIGSIRVTKFVLPYLIKRNEAVIINVSSQAGKYGHDGFTGYSPSKFGLRGFTQALADELPNNVRTYVVNPDTTRTAMSKFRGVSSDNVASIIINVAMENIGKKSGEDIDILNR